MIPVPGSAGVPFTVENRGSSTIYLVRCGERLVAALDRWESSQWVQHSGDLCQMVHAMDPQPLAPGATLSSIRGVLEPGRYRLRPGVGLNVGEPSEWRQLVVESPWFCLEDPLVYLAAVRSR